MEGWMDGHTADNAGWPFASGFKKTCKPSVVMITLQFSCYVIHYIIMS